MSAPLVAGLLALLIASGMNAQQPAARMVALPDTLGANFAIADSATKTASPGDFDFLVGLWEFRFQNRRKDGSYQPPFAGHWFVEKRNVKGGMIEDHWRADAPTASLESGTYSYRVYSPSRKLWTMQGVNADVGFWEPGLAWTDGESRCVVQHYDGFMMRIRYFDITPTSFLWRGDISNDNGLTWTRDWWIMEGKRIGK